MSCSPTPPSCHNSSAAPSCPALMVAAPASGHGKTTVVAALARLHARQGRRVQVFKCGPDFIDPGWHQIASGQPVDNLDVWMCGEADIRQRLAKSAACHDLILVEGVMGLFDGHSSAADVAALLHLPVLVMVDASHMAETFGAVVFGLQHWRAGLRWAGALANRVASAGHAAMLQRAVPEGFAGALLAHNAMRLPERHLGLTAAHELPDALQRLDAAADVLAQTPLGQMDAAALELWRTVFPVPAAQTMPVPCAPLLAGRTVAVARDAAFQFIYPANVRTLQDLGAEVVFFSPLADAALPACDALWLPGGYPELHAQPLAANTAMRQAICAHVAADKPVWAECGGMMALFEHIQQTDGSTSPLWGVLPGTVRMQARLARLGAQQLLWEDVARADGVACTVHSAPPPELRGHTFHYSVVETPLPARLHTQSPQRAHAGEALYTHGSVRASYFHPWFASSPRATAWLFGAHVDAHIGRASAGGR